MKVRDSANIMKATSKTASSRRRGSPVPPPAIDSTSRHAAPDAVDALDEETRAQLSSTPDLDRLLVSTNIAMLLLDRKKRVLRFTPPIASLFSLLPTDIGRPIRDLTQKFDDTVFLADVRAVLDGGNTSQKEIRSSDGRWYVRQTLPYRLPNGAIEGAVITFSDVAGDAIREARLYAETIVDTVREPLLVLDADLKVHSVNKPFSSLFHVPSQDVLGRAVHDLDGGIWDVPELLTKMTDVLENGEAIEDFEISYPSPTLGSRALLLNARTLRRGGGRPDLILVAIEDVTERRRIQELLHENDERRRHEERLQQRQLELTNAMRVSTVGELATGLAHELNQPLSSISNTVEACSQYVRAGKFDAPKLLGLLADVAEESMRAAGIVAHLRSFVDKGEPQLEDVDLGDIVQHIPQLLLRELERLHVELRVDISDAALPVRADRIQIEQVLVNLIRNAMDSIQDAEGPLRLIELTVRTVDGRAEVGVRDSGTGLSDTSAARMFDAFYTTKKQGLGMGLALSRSIMEAHHGRIWMELPSEERPGAVVRFAIPLRETKRRRKDRTA